VPDENGGHQEIEVQEKVPVFNLDTREVEEKEKWVTKQIPKPDQDSASKSEEENAKKSISGAVVALSVTSFAATIGYLLSLLSTLGTGASLGGMALVTAALWAAIGAGVMAGLFVVAAALFVISDYAEGGNSNNQAKEQSGEEEKGSAEEKPYPL